MNRVSKDLKEAILESYRNGYALRDIASYFGLSYTTVRYHVFASGIALRSRGRSVREEANGLGEKSIGG